MTELRFVALTPDLAAPCARLELRALPHADPQEVLGEDDILAYAKTFPEGFIVCLDGDRVVGQGAGIYVDFDFDRPQRSIVDITGEHQCGNHDPDADWYYGTGIVVDPEYRRQGIGARLYELRKDLVKRDNKRGIIAGGHMHGYARHAQELTPDQYLEKVRSGRIYDATLTFQMHSGFRLVRALEDSASDDGDSHWALIVWDNLEYRPGGRYSKY